MAGLYEIVCLPTGKRYIGSSVNTRARMRCHKNRLAIQSHDNSHLQRAWNKYGPERFTFRLLVILPREMLADSEYSLIGKYSDAELFNLTRAAVGRVVLSPETREKIRAALVGRPRSAETIAKVRAARRGQKGHPRSPETKAKIGDGNRGRIKTPETMNRLRAANRRNGAARRGIKRDAEIGRKISAAKKGKPFSKSHRAALSLARRNYLAMNRGSA